MQNTKEQQLRQQRSSQIFTYSDSQYHKRISVRPVSYEQDLERIFNWMHQKHLVPFWKLNVSFETFQTYLQKSLMANHKDLYIASVGDQPICYTIIYQVPQDSIHHYYPYRNSDIGAHIAIGRRNFLNQEYIFPIVRGLASFVFNQYDTERIIVEPDVKNKIVIPTLEQCGFDTYGKIKLPHKRANLMILEKKKFFEVLSNLPKNH